MKYKIPQRWSMVSRFIVHRLNEDRDVKAVVTGKGATTGISKTTGAIHLCDFIHSIQQCANCKNYTFPNSKNCHRCGSYQLSNQQDKWHPDTGGFFDPWEYIEYYSEHSTDGECLLLDEAEFSIHKRRAMSSENVEMSKIWSALRYRNNFSILTLPSTSMIDSLMMELGDLWFNAVKKGVFHVYYYFYNDFTQQVRPYRVVNEFGMPVTFEFKPLDDDERKQIMDDRKKEYTQNEGDERFDSDDMESAKDDVKIIQRIGITEKLLAKTKLNQKEIAKLIEPEEGEAMSQQWVSKVNTGDLNQQDDDNDKYPIRG